MAMSNACVPGTSIDDPDGPSTTPRTRKMVRQPDKWQRSVSKRLRNSGEEYVTAKKKPVSVRGHTGIDTSSSSPLLKCGAILGQIYRLHLLSSGSCQANE